jgi:hypothetical protein
MILLGFIYRTWKSDRDAVINANVGGNEMKDLM